MSGCRQGYTCACGVEHCFPLYVAAHWDEVLSHICSGCKRENKVLRGKVTIGRKPKASK